jgi:hypothetical protein
VLFRTKNFNFERQIFVFSSSQNVTFYNKKNKKPKKVSLQNICGFICRKKKEKPFTCIVTIEQNVHEEIVLKMN